MDSKKQGDGKCTVIGLRSDFLTSEKIERPFYSIAGINLSQIPENDGLKDQKCLGVVDIPPHPLRWLTL